MEHRPLGLGGAHRRHLPRGRRAGRQTWRRRLASVGFVALSAFGVLGAVSVISSGAGGAIPAVAFALVLAPFPYLARPLRGGRLGARAPRRAWGLRVSVARAAARGEELDVRVRGRAEVGLIGTAWVDRSLYQGTAAEPVRVFETWTWAEGVARLRVPADAPFSYEGRHLSTAWAVAVRRPSGRVAMRPVWVTA